MTPRPLPGGAAADGLERSAHFSPCRIYRYGLWRRWGQGHTLMVVGLNPSTADDTQDNPTIRRCIGFARAWGFGALCMANLFAYRAVSPDRLRQAADPIGPENDRSLQELADGARLVLPPGAPTARFWTATGRCGDCCRISTSCGSPGPGNRPTRCTSRRT